MAANDDVEKVTVGIVGGGVAGLALAKMLEMSGISYKLFEAHELVSPRGASLGLMPNGLRILDQLGVVDQIEEYSVAHDHWEHRDGQTGELYASTRALAAYPKVFGYGAFFMERQHISKIVFNSIKDTSRLEGFKKVAKIDNLDDYAVATATDGSSFHCQVVAGADGTHSMVRRLIRQESPATQTPSEYLTAKTYCVFGISSPLTQIGEGRHFTIYRSDASVLVFSGLNGKLYWFIFKKLASPLRYGTRKAFGDDDVEEAYALVSQVMITEGVRFSDIYEKTEYRIILPIEQGICETWYAKRMFLLGDAAHKMAPHAAMGANLAMESAACFVNELRKLTGCCRTPSDQQSVLLSPVQLAQCLQSYTQKRLGRVTEVATKAGLTEEVNLKIDPAASRFIGALPRMSESDWLGAGLFSLCKAVKLENWDWDSDRVNLYTKHAEDATAAAATGQGKEHVSSLLNELGWS